MKSLRCIQVEPPFSGHPLLDHFPGKKSDRDTSNGSILRGVYSWSHPFQINSLGLHAGGSTLPDQLPGKHTGGATHSQINSIWGHTGGATSPTLTSWGAYTWSQLPGKHSGAPTPPRSIPLGSIAISSQTNSLGNIQVEPPTPD